MNSNHPNFATVNSWMQEARQQIGVAMTLNEDGLCTLEFEDALFVTIAVPVEGTHFSLQAMIYQGHPDASLPVLAEALRLNLDFNATRTGSIGLHDASEGLIFRYWHAIEGCSAIAFAAILANFTATCYELRERLAATAAAMLDGLNRSAGAGGMDRVFDPTQRV